MTRPNETRLMLNSRCIESLSLLSPNSNKRIEMNVSSMHSKHANLRLCTCLNASRHRSRRYNNDVQSIRIEHDVHSLSRCNERERERERERETLLLYYASRERASLAVSLSRACARFSSHVHLQSHFFFFFFFFLFCVFCVRVRVRPSPTFLSQRTISLLSSPCLSVCLSVFVSVSLAV
jgi:hypothetical protein